MAIPTRIFSLISNTAATAKCVTGGGTNYVVETPNKVQYQIYNNSSFYLVFKKSIDFGITWSAETTLMTATCDQWAVWYDRWTDPTGVLGDLIHVCYSNATSDNVFYRSIDTENSDTLGTERTVFDGASTANGGAISISRMRGGNLIVAGCIDNGVEPYAYKSSNLFASAGTAIVNPYETTPDLLIIMPGWGADTNDAMCFYYDASGTEISVKYYDDSADSWSETSIATSITFPNHTTTTLGHWSASVDNTNSQNLVAFWTATDTLNADLRVFKVTQSAQTETASNVVLNSVDDQGFAVISIDITTNYWYVFYMGKSDGTETYATDMNLYYKYSVDSGANWSSEIRLSEQKIQTLLLWGKPIFYGHFGITMFLSNNAPYMYIYNAPLLFPRTTFQLGM